MFSLIDLGWDRRSAMLGCGKKHPELKFNGRELNLMQLFLNFLTGYIIEDITFICSLAEMFYGMGCVWGRF